MRRSISYVAIALLLIVAPTYAQTYPALTKPVNDFAGVIDAASAAEMEKEIRALEAATHDVVVVATVKTIAPAGSIEEYAVKLFERAGIGQKGKDNGVLILLALQERRARIEVGYEIEGLISDGYAGDTIRQTMLPEFRNGQYGAGLLAGTTRVIQRIAEKRGITLADVPKAPEEPRQRFPPTLFIIIGFIVLMMVLGASRGGPRGSGRIMPRRPGWPGGWSGWSGGVGGFGGRFGGGSFGGFGGGGGGGGFGGFGGGRSGGGGASGGW